MFRVAEYALYSEVTIYLRARGVSCIVYYLIGYVHRLLGYIPVRYGENNATIKVVMMSVPPSPLDGMNK